MTGRVFQRGKLWWIAYYHSGRELRESTKLLATEPNHRRAERFLHERLRKAGTPAFIGPEVRRLCFDDLANLYLNDYRNNGRRSIRDAKRLVENLRGTFGFDRALDITADRIEAYKATRLKDGRRPATVNRELAALRRMFSLAVKTGRLPFRPYIAMLDESDNIREGFFEPVELDVVCANLQADIADVVRFAYLTGWRRGEVLRLEWQDVDLRGGSIRLRAAHSKNKRTRVVMLRDELLDLVQRRAGVRQLDCTFVFHRRGRPIRAFRAAWRDACEAAGLAGRLFHDLRRSAVRNMVRAGVPERVAMAISGHKTRNVFDRYNIVSEDDLASAAERTMAFIAEKRTEAPRIVALAGATAATGDGQNTDNPPRGGGGGRGSSRRTAPTHRKESAASAPSSVRRREHAEEGNRTPTPFRTADFESAASASSATSAREATGAPYPNPRPR